MIDHYFINFCNEGTCFDKDSHCTYPTIKTGILRAREQRFNPKTQNIKKISFSIDAVDKFQNIWANGVWDVSLQIEELPIHMTFDNKKNGTVINCSLEVNNTPKIMSYCDFTKSELSTQLELKFNDKIACPLTLDLFIEYEDII